MRNLVKKRLEQLRRLLKDYDDNEIEQLYTKEHPERQKLIQPVRPTWEQRLNEWEKEAYKGKAFAENIPVIQTAKGERVRSKSEKILADYFYHAGISYKYEHPIFLKGFVQFIRILHFYLGKQEKKPTGNMMGEWMTLSMQEKLSGRLKLTRKMEFFQDKS